MTLIFFFNGSSGASVLPSFIVSPLPRDHQWLPLMPFPINSTANRFGNCAADTDRAGLPQAGNDSSHGRHIATPAPRRTVLLVIVRVMFFPQQISRAGWEPVLQRIVTLVLERKSVGQVPNLPYRLARRQFQGHSCQFCANPALTGLLST